MSYLSDYVKKKKSTRNEDSRSYPTRSVVLEENIFSKDASSEKKIETNEFRRKIHRRLRSIFRYESFGRIVYNFLNNILYSYGEAVGNISSAEY